MTETSVNICVVSMKQCLYSDMEKNVFCAIEAIGGFRHWEISEPWNKCMLRLKMLYHITFMF